MPMLVLHWFFIFDNGSTIRIDEQSWIQSECCVLMCSGGGGVLVSLLSLSLVTKAHLHLSCLTINIINFLQSSIKCSISNNKDTYDHQPHRHTDMLHVNITHSDPLTAEIC